MFNCYRPAPVLYNLFAVVVHLGTINSGHYINYVRVMHDWYKCDDTTITLTTEEEVKTCAA
jgi:ubiquitin carboxyl-terminal hydrolase 22/27/51